MKKLFKSLVSLTAAGTMLLSTTAFAAASLSTVTTYDTSTKTATVTSKVKSTVANEMITYLATTDSTTAGDYSVDSTGSNIVYIGQQTATNAGEEVEFKYTLTDKVNSATYASVRSGSSAGTTLPSAAQYVGIYDVTVNVVGPDGTAVTDAVTVTGANNVGVGSNATINLWANDGYEIVKVLVGDTEKDFASALSVSQGSTVTVTVLPTTETAVYVLSGATIDTDSDYSGDGYSSTAGVVKVVGSISKCDLIFYTGKDSTEPLKVDETDRFSVSNLSGTGYYGVEVVGSAEEKLGNYKYVTAKYTVESDSAEVNAQIIE
ncbi:MAG: hypothetical protein IJ365_08990 [Clostridia bacterium]|nr:hypothetical protein [Clostridia bacterium]